MGKLCPFLIMNGCENTFTNYTNCFPEFPNTFTVFLEGKVKAKCTFSSCIWGFTVLQMITFSFYFHMKQHSDLGSQD